MKMLRILIFGVVALAQLAVPATMVWQRDQTLKQGRVWKFRTAPVDPVDVIRGRYIALRFTAEEFAAELAVQFTGLPVEGQDDHIFFIISQPGVPEVIQLFQDDQRADD